MDIFSLYWKLHKQGLPLLVMVLAASEVWHSENWAEMLEAYIAGSGAW